MGLALSCLSTGRESQALRWGGGGGGDRDRDRET